MKRRVVMLILVVLALALVTGPVVALCADACAGGPGRVMADPTARPLPGTPSYGGPIWFSTRTPGE